MRERVRRLALEKYKITKAAFEELVKLGVCRPSSSSWASPLLLRPKPNGEGLFPCGDYRGPNAITIEDRYPSPTFVMLQLKSKAAPFFQKLTLLSLTTISLFVPVIFPKLRSSPLLAFTSLCV